jgi:hypothetical protein
MPIQRKQIQSEQIVAKVIRVNLDQMIALMSQNNAQSLVPAVMMQNAAGLMVIQKPGMRL